MPSTARRRSRSRAACRRRSTAPFGARQEGSVRARQHRRDGAHVHRRDAARTCSATPTSPCTRPSRTARTASRRYRAGDARRGHGASGTPRRSGAGHGARRVLPRLPAHRAPQRRRPTGVEALLRWRHPERGVVNPTEFVPLAEETGLIVKLGRWVLERGVPPGARMGCCPVSCPPVTINVNVSARQLQEPDFVDEVRRILEQTPACRPAGDARVHREPAAARHGADDQHPPRAQGAWRAPRHRRLRHGLLVAVVSAPAAHRRAQDRSAHSSPGCRASRTRWPSFARSSSWPKRSISRPSPRASRAWPSSTHCAAWRRRWARASCSPQPLEAAHGRRSCLAAAKLEPGSDCTIGACAGRPSLPPTSSRPAHVRGIAHD